MTPLDDNITIGEKYGPALHVRTQAEADAYFARLLDHARRAYGDSPEEAALNERNNLSYYAAYFSNDARRLVEQFYGAVHPVFGPVKPQGETTADEAMAAYRKGLADGRTFRKMRHIPAARILRAINLEDE